MLKALLLISVCKKGVFCKGLGPVHLLFDRAFTKQKVDSTKGGEKKKVDFRFG
ncbi:hypothetical protein WH47_05496 [Habropoda laboriosa]|uniref:Uncharacterized protein n=1 Tax=Habropoda laboriosa TaxID=597456 RepID=A0A0L7RFE8_9HYME|nr:hypothetical protein WH47_05496 [Habropoda laboriosa]